MRLHQALFVVVVSFFATTFSLSAATEIEQAKGSTLLSRRSIVSHDGAQGRSLRAVDTEDESSDLRGLWTHAKVNWWLEWEKSDDYIREALKLKGLKGEALTNHKNYKAFQYFLKKSEEYKLNKWYRNEYTTYQGWQELGLDKKITLAKDLDKIRNTDRFKTYTNYVNYHGTMVYYTMRAGQSPPKVMVMRGASDAEMTARAEIMADAGRSAKYAKLALGLTDSAYPRANLLSGPELKGSPDFKYFQLFLKRKEPAITEELKKLETAASLKKLSSSKRHRQKELLEEMGWVKKYVTSSGSGGGRVPRV